MPHARLPPAPQGRAAAAGAELDGALDGLDSSLAVLEQRVSGAHSSCLPAAPCGARGAATPQRPSKLQAILRPFFPVLLLAGLERGLEEAKQQLQGGGGSCAG